jgi:hypothetical protein
VKIAFHGDDDVTQVNVAGGYEEAIVEIDPPPISQLTAAEARARR